MSIRRLEDVFLTHLFPVLYGMSFKKIAAVGQQQP